jgi:hypothetical protein
VGEGGFVVVGAGGDEAGVVVGAGLGGSVGARVGVFVGEGEGGVVVALVVRFEAEGLDMGGGVGGFGVVGDAEEEFK